jgi:multidrug efflux system outer membrane protein
MNNALAKTTPCSHKSKAISAAILLAFLLAGCNSYRNYEVPDAPDGTLEINLVQRNDDRYQARTPVLRWWGEFDDPQLVELVELSLKTNLDIRVALSNLFEARGIVNETEFDRFPSVSTRVNYARTRLSEDGVNGPVAQRSIDNYEAGFDASWELDLFGRVSQRIEAQQALADAALADLQDVYTIVGAEVARTYIELRGAQYQLDIAQRNVKNQQQLLEITKRLSEGGRSTALDVSRARTEVALTSSTIPPLKARVDAAINRISVLTGQVPDALRLSLSNTRPLPSLPANIAVGDASSLLKRRPDVRRAEKELASSVARYNLASAEFFPSVNITGSLGFNASNFGDLGESNLSGFIGPSLNWRIFDFGRVRAEIAQADARSLVALARYEQTALIALEETQTALSDFSQEEQRRIILQDAARYAQKSSELANQRFTQGVDNFLDVLDAERTLLEAENTLAESETSVGLKLVAIYKSLGGGWEIPSQ